jgi:hypothetical protein
VEGGIETGNLREVRIPLRKPLDQFDLSREMLWVKRAQSLQLFYDSGGYHLGFTIMSATMHYPMSDRAEWMMREHLFDTIQ